MVIKYIFTFVISDCHLILDIDLEFTKDICATIMRSPPLIKSSLRDTNTIFQSYYHIMLPKFSEKFLILSCLQAFIMGIESFIKRQL